MYFLPWRKFPKILGDLTSEQIFTEIIRWVPLVKTKFETEKYIANKNGTFASFRRRWEAILVKLV